MLLRHIPCFSTRRCMMEHLIWFGVVLALLLSVMPTTPAPAQYQVHPPPRKNTTACFKTCEAGSVSSRNMSPASWSPDRATAVQRERPLSEMVFFDIAHRQVWTGWGVYNWLKRA